MVRISLFSQFPNETPSLVLRNSLTFPAINREVILPHKTLSLFAMKSLYFAMSLDQNYRWNPIPSETPIKISESRFLLCFEPTDQQVTSINIHHVCITSNQPQGRPSALLHVLARSVPPWGVTASEGQALVSIEMGYKRGIPKRLGLCHGKSMDDLRIAPFQETSMSWNSWIKASSITD